MTTASATRASASTDGTTDTFSASFRANSAAEVGVSLVNNTTKAVTAPVLNTDYVVALNATTGAPTVVFDTAPASGSTVIIYPKNTVQQTTDLDAGDPLYGTSIEAALDKLAAELQAVKDELAQCLRYAQGDAAPSTLADGATRDNTFVTFNSTGVLTLRPLSDVGL